MRTNRTSSWRIVAAGSGAREDAGLTGAGQKALGLLVGRCALWARRMGALIMTRTGIEPERHCEPGVSAGYVEQCCLGATTE